jgi:cation-transporting ATPase 13A3/4/5
LRLELPDDEEPWLGLRPRHSLHLVSSTTLTANAQRLAAHGPNAQRVAIISTGLLSYLAVLLGLSAAWIGQRTAAAAASRANLDVADDAEPFFQAGYSTRILGTIVRTGWIGLGLLANGVLAFLIYCYYTTMDDAGIYPIYAAVLYPTGLFLLVVLRLPQTAQLFLAPCSLGAATHVLLGKGAATKGKAAGWFDWLYAENETVAAVESDGGPKRWFTYLCVRYVWASEEGRFLPAGEAHFEGKIPSEGLTSAYAKAKVAEIPNVIDVAVPTVGEALATEFSGAFYVFQLMAVWMALIWSAWNEGIIFLALGLITGTFHGIFVVRKQRVRVQEMARFDEPVEVLRDGKWGSISSTLLVPGDVLKPGTGTVPCDCVLLSGGAVSSEAMLTGEPMPVQKFPFEGQGPVKAGKHKKHILFAGTHMLQASDAVCVATATGAMTAKGQLVRMVLFPSEVKFKFTTQLPYVVMILVVYGFACMATIAIGLDSSLDPLTVLFSGTFCVLQALSPLLPVALSAGQSVAAGRLKDFGVQCLDPPRITVGGELQVFVFDKTGTLTESGMDLVGMRPQLGPLVKDPAAAGDLWPTVLASCHTVGMVGGQLVGPELEVRMLEASGYHFASGEGSGRSFSNAEGARVDVVRALEFDHDRMTSGALVRAGGKAVLMVKGSYERVETLCPVPKDYKAVTKQTASDNYYVLGVAYREVTEAEVEKLLHAPRAEVEKDLKFLGLLLFRNQLKPDSASAIAALRAGNIRTVMCTGDNVYTGVAIARECNLISAGKKVVIGDAEAGAESKALVWRDDKGQVVSDLATVKDCELAVTGVGFAVLLATGELASLLLRIRVFGRMLPDQKVQVVNAHQAQNFVTGMCGDGGNDCAALRAAHVGVALSEAEASIVAPFSSGANKSCHATVEVVKMGRACLSTNLASYRFFIVTGLTVTTWKVVQLCFGGFYPGEWQFLYMDIIAPVVFTWAMTTCCYPAAVLAPTRPDSSLFSADMIMSILCVHAFFGATLAFMWVTLVNEPWFEGYSPEFLAYIYDHATPLAGSSIMLTGDNYIAASIFLIVCVHLMTSALAYSRGGAFRRPVYKSLPMMGTVVLVLLLAGSLLYGGPSRYHCLFRVNCSNEVAKESYIPFASEFSTTAVPGQTGNCFFGPQAGPAEGKGWYPDYKMKYPECEPPAGSGLPRIDGGVGPNNIFPSEWRTFLSSATGALGVCTLIFANFILGPLARLLDSPVVIPV